MKIMLTFLTSQDFSYCLCCQIPKISLMQTIFLIDSFWNVSTTVQIKGKHDKRKKQFKSRIWFDVTIVIVSQKCRTFLFCFILECYRKLEGRASLIENIFCTMWQWRNMLMRNNQNILWAGFRNCYGVSNFTLLDCSLIDCFDWEKVTQIMFPKQVQAVTSSKIRLYSDGTSKQFVIFPILCQLIGVKYMTASRRIIFQNQWHLIFS